MSCQEVLAVRVVQVSTNDAAARDANVVLGVGVQEHRVVNLTTESDGVVQLHDTVVVAGRLLVHHAALTLGLRLLLHLRLHLLLARFHSNLNLLYDLKL